MQTEKIITFIDGNFSTIEKFKPYEVVKEFVQNGICYFYFVDDEGKDSCVQYDFDDEPKFFTIAPVEVEEQ